MRFVIVAFPGLAPVRRCVLRRMIWVYIVQCLPVNLFGVSRLKWANKTSKKICLTSLRKTDFAKLFTSQKHDKSRYNCDLHYCITNPLSFSDSVLYLTFTLK